jgi:hypothetical protein
MLSINGQAIATTASITPNQPVMFRPTLSAPMISTSTEPGATLRTTATSGLRQWRPVGLLIRTGTGFTSIRGDGLGLSTSHGDMRRSTMVAGFMPAASGDGLRDPTMLVRTTLRRWLRGLAADSDLGSASAADSDGARWVLANRSFPGMA